jgi:hypothetical protein
LRDLGKESVLARAPEEQYLVATGRTYFRDLSFDDLRRMQFDRETTGLNPDRDRIFRPNSHASLLAPGYSIY